MFDFSKIKEMFSFSIGVVGAALLSSAGSSIYGLIVGKRYSVDDLAYFDKGDQLPRQASLYTFGAMSSVLLPTLASYQTDLTKVKKVVRKVSHMTSYLIAPMMVGLALTTKEIVLLLFTEKWLPIVRIMQYDCLYYYATPFLTINVQVFFALGHSEKRVYTEIIRLIMLLAGALVFGILLNCSVEQLALVCAMISVFSSFITYLEVRPMIRYSVREMMKDIFPSLFCAMIMGGFIFLTDSLFHMPTGILGTVLILIIKIVTGIVVYIGLSVIFKLQGFNEVKSMLKSLRRKHA